MNTFSLFNDEVFVPFRIKASLLLTINDIKYVSKGDDFFVKWIYSLCTISFTFMIMIGCQQTESNNENARMNMQQEEAQNEERRIYVQQTAERKETLKTNKEIATHLATVANDVPNVRDAVAIIAGPYTVVGIDIDGNIERERVGTIKYSVSEALQNDPYGKTAIVIADADIVDRLRQMNEQMRAGEPIQGVVEQLATIVARYMPTFPVPEKSRDDYDLNEDNLRDEEKEQLEEIQQEQAND